MSIKSRLQKVEDKVSNEDEKTIAVFITTDDDSIITCYKRRVGCPDYPCEQDRSCWWLNEHPNAKIICVDAEDNEG